LTTSPHAQMLQVGGWQHIPGLVHGFCGRLGGVSRGPFAALNLATRVGDDAAAVGENWRRMRAVIGATMQMALPQQVHGAEVLAVDDGLVDQPAADAVAARVPQVAVAVLTADCAPLLLVAAGQHVVAAVHAGWRGTVAGIAARAIDFLQQRFAVPPAGVSAALGPTIGACCYEVGTEIVDALETRWGTMPGAVTRRHGPGKARLDLRHANTAILEAAGVPANQIVHVGPCTCCAAAEYFSYRAARGAEGVGVTGRQLSFIGWQS